MIDRLRSSAIWRVGAHCLIVSTLVNAAPQRDYLWRLFSLSRACFSSSSFCPASPSLPSAVRRW
jgi:hypothetical protein